MLLNWNPYNLDMNKDMKGYERRPFILTTWLRSVMWWNVRKVWGRLSCAILQLMKVISQLRSCTRNVQGATCGGAKRCTVSALITSEQRKGSFSHCGNCRSGVGCGFDPPV